MNVLHFNLPCQAQCRTIVALFSRFYFGYWTPLLNSAFGWRHNDNLLCNQRLQCSYHDNSVIHTYSGTLNSWTVYRYTLINRGRMMHICVGKLSYHWMQRWLVTSSATSQYLNKYCLIIILAWGYGEEQPVGYLVIRDDNVNVDNYVRTLRTLSGNLLDSVENIIWRQNSFSCVSTWQCSGPHGALNCRMVGRARQIYLPFNGHLSLRTLT